MGLLANNVVIFFCFVDYYCCFLDLQLFSMSLHTESITPFHYTILEIFKGKNAYCLSRLCQKIKYQRFLVSKIFGTKKRAIQQICTHVTHP